MLQVSFALDDKEAMKLDLRNFDNCGNLLSEEFDDSILKSRSSFVAKWRELLANIASKFTYVVFKSSFCTGRN